jgi:hypothetical protein
MVILESIVVSRITIFSRQALGAIFPRIRASSRVLPACRRLASGCTILAFGLAGLLIYWPSAMQRM